MKRGERRERSARALERGIESFVYNRIGGGVRGLGREEDKDVRV